MTQVEQYVDRAEEMKSLLKTKRPTTAPDQQKTVRLLGKTYNFAFWLDLTHQNLLLRLIFFYISFL